MLNCKCCFYDWIPSAFSASWKSKGPTLMYFSFSTSTYINTVFYRINQSSYYFLSLYCRFCLDDNEGSSSDTAPLFQMAGDGRNTDDVTFPLLFLFHKEGNILLEALKEYREVEVLLSDKARDRGETLSKTWKNVNMWGRWFTLHHLISFLSNYSSFYSFPLCL